MTFTAIFRYRTAEGILEGCYKHIKAASKAQAKRIGKGLEGRGDDMTWFIGLTGEVRS